MAKKLTKRAAYLAKYREHIEHTVTLTNGNTGTLERVSDDGEFIWCWIGDGVSTFPNRHDPMELKACVTCDKKDGKNG